MSIRITVGRWISHDNMLLSAARYHAELTGERVDIACRPDAGLPLATFWLDAGGRRAFVDYNDRYEFEAAGADADVYAKRTLYEGDLAPHVFPIGFHFNYSHALHRLLLRPGFLAYGNRTELVRALDLAGLTSWSHAPRRVDDVFAPPVDHGGRVIFYVRLWDPARNLDGGEQERRRKMNATRIAVVRRLRALDNTAAGILPAPYSREICPDLLLSERETISKNYAAELRRADIGVANEGLRGSPGWKIGEYVAGSKAVISNAIESVVPGFVQGTNYARFEDAAEILDLVADLRRNGAYRAMQDANWRYTSEHLHPRVYLRRILDRLAA